MSKKKPMCQVCHKEAREGVICAWDFARLETVMDRVPSAWEDLASPHRRRHGETVRASSAPGIPISVAAMDAREGVQEALWGAVRGLWPSMPRLVAPDAARLLQAHWKRVRGSWVAPVLLLELEPAVAAAVRAVDTPRGRMTIPGRCRQCGPSMLHPEGGGLVCDRCGERHSVGEVRRAG